MKKSLQIFALLFCTIIFAQAPEKFSYQAIIRNASNALVTNTPVGVKISILKTSAAGTVVYAETQTATTNVNGLVSIQIGDGTIISGTIAGIDWATDSYYIKTETDPAGGTNYTIAGTTQLLSVPYALYSKSSGGGPAFTLPYTAAASSANGLFKITNNGSGAALEGLSTSAAPQSSAVMGTMLSGAAGAFSAGVRGINNGTGASGIGVYGSHNGSGYGVYGTTTSGTGIYGDATGTGIGGYFVGATTGFALRTVGPIRLGGIGNGAGKVLTSDATGNATWEDMITPNVHFASTGGSSQTITSGTTPIVITSWTGIEEAGGANYNSTTGEYTVPITGYYYVMAQVSYTNANTVDANVASLQIRVDNAVAKEGFSNEAKNGDYYSDCYAVMQKKLIAGQKIKITTNQAGRPTNSLWGPATNFVIHLVHR